MFNIYNTPVFIIVSIISTIVTINTEARGENVRMIFADSRSKSPHPFRIPDKQTMRTSTNENVRVVQNKFCCLSELLSGFERGAGI